MNRDPDSALQRDLFAASAAALRRKTRARRQATAVLALACFFGALAIITLPPNPSPDLLSPIGSAPAVIPGPASPQPGPGYQTLTTDEELLAAVADQGPMLITHPDGRKQLILTRP